MEGNSPVYVSGTSGGPGENLSTAEPMCSQLVRRGVIQAIIEGGSGQIC